MIIPGHREYWPQFPGQREAELKSAELFQNLLEECGVEVIRYFADDGTQMVDTPEKAFEAGIFFKKNDIDLCFIYLPSYVASGRWMIGAKQVYPGRYEPEMILKLVDKEKVTFSHCVPTILQMLVHSPSARQLDLSRWTVIIGGSALPRGLASAARELGITVYSGYGMSETCPVISLSTPTSLMGELDDDRLVVIADRSVSAVLAHYVMDHVGHRKESGCNQEQRGRSQDI